MDPDTALFELREAIANLLDPDIKVVDNVERIGELFQALDEWITKGGFLPIDWRPAEPTIGTEYSLADPAIARAAARAAVHAAGNPE